MSLFYTECKKILKPIFESYGFKLYKRYFYRVVGDVFQHCCMLGLNHECTIRFFVEPLFCVSESEGREGEGPFELSYLYGDPVDWLKYDPKNIESIREVSKQLAKYVEDYLIPWFLKTETIENAYKEACDLSISIAGSSIRVRKEYFFLKLKRYDELEKMLKGRILSAERFKQLRFQEQKIETEKEKEEFMKWAEWRYEYLKEYEEILYYLEGRNEERISNYVKEREQKSLEILEWNRK